MTQPTLADSAFLVNESRSRRADISKDIYAHLWVTASTKKIWEHFTTEVYPHDDVELSLRNRFYLEHLIAFINATQTPVFINIASGFTSYPYLINQPCTCIEIDLPQVITFKRKNITQWQRKGILPPRDIIFFPADIEEKHEVDRLQNYLAPLTTDHPSFILLEGITYFLQRETLQRLMTMCSEIQRPLSLIAFDFWKPCDATHPVMKRLSRFFAKQFHFPEAQYHFFEIDQIQILPRYETVDVTTIQELEKRYTTTTVLDDYNTILPEQYAILKKKRTE